MGESLQPDNVEDRPLSEKDLDLIARGRGPTGGNGSYVSFADLPPATLAEYRERRIETMRKKREGKKLAELSAYIDAHREHAAEIIGSKLVLMDGLMGEMSYIDPQTGEQAYNTKLLDEKRMKVLVQIINEFEKSAGLRAEKKTESTVNVNVSHLVSELKRSLKA